jgi:osmoprotectant transport system substrate-binding protein
MSRLNACVELGADGEPNSGDEMSVEEVASAFLEKERLDCLPRPIQVGSRLINRNVWVGKGLVSILKDRGYEVVDKTSFGPRPVIREAMLKGEIDMYCERTTQVLMEFHDIPPQGLPDEPEALYTLVKTLDESLGLTWIAYSKNQIFPTLVVEPTLYEEKGIQSIAELADFMNSNDAPLDFCVEKGFYKAPDGILALEEYYGFKFNEENIVWTDPQVLDRYPNYEEMRDGACDVTHGSSVDDIEPWGFRVLTDSKSFFPPSVPGIVLRKDLLEEYPELADSMVCVSDYLDTESLIALNRATWGADEVQGTGDDVSMDTVALPYFCEQGLVKNNCPTVGAKPTVEPEGGVEETPVVDGKLTPTPGATAIPSNLECRELVLNGDFERDEAWELPGTSGTSQYRTEVAHSGIRAMQLGSLINDDYVSHSLTKQLLQIPSNVESATLSYWYYPVSQNPSEGEEQGALIYSGDESFVWRKLQEGASNEQAWIKQEHDLSALIGEEIYLYFYLNSNGDGWTSAMYLDEVSLQICSSPQSSTPPPPPPPLESKETIIIGSDELIENLLGGKMLLLLLQNAGYKVEDKTALGDTLAVREALINGEIDLHWEVTGSALTLFHNLPFIALPSEPTRSYELIKKLDQQESDLVWVDKANVNTSYVLMVQPSTYEQGIGTLEELADFMIMNEKEAKEAPFKLCVDEGFYAQPEGFSGLQVHYGFQFKEENILIGEFDESYQGLRERRCEVAVGLNTDGRISAWEFKILEDSKKFFPAYTWGLVTRPDILAGFPGLEEVLRQITSGVTHEAVRQPNVRLKLGPDLEPNTGDEESLDDVARLFLCEAGMIDLECP